jgi:protease-4
MGSKLRWILLGVAGLLILLFMFGSSEPAIEDGSVLVLELSGTYVDGTTAPSLLDFFGSDERSVLATISRLRRAQRDDRIATIVLRVRDVNLGWGQAEEIRSVIAAIEADGKPTISILEFEGYGNAEYYLASAAGRVVATPGGHNPFVGLASEYLFYGGLLEKLGIVVEYERIGRYKSAVEAYAHTKPTDSNREMVAAMLDSVEANFVGGIAEARGMTPDHVRGIIDEAPTSPEEFIAHDLVDEVAFYDEVITSLGDPTVVEPAVFDGVSGESLGFEPAGTFAIVYGSGPVVNGAAGRTVSGGRVMASDTVAASLREAAEREDIDAIIFRVNSPGGSPLASDLILREVKRARELGKPVVVSMSDLAASGGYYVACGADRIVSHPSTLTGSIGVFTIRPSMGGLYEKLGIGVENVTRGARADLLLGTDPLSPDAREVLKRDVEAIYSLFLDRVEDGREMEREAIDAVARGRVWTGSQALEIGLVDRLGGFRAAKEEAMALAGIEAGSDVALVEFPRPKPIGQQLMELLGAQVESRMPQPPLPEDVREMWAVLEMFPPGRPLLLPPAWITIH